MKKELEEFALFSKTLKKRRYLEFLSVSERNSLVAATFFAERERVLRKGNFDSSIIKETNAMDNDFQQEQRSWQETQYQDPGQNQNTYQQQPDWHDSYRNDQNDQPGNGFGIASLVLGILALCFFCACLNIPLGILSIIFAVIHINRHTGSIGFAVAGIVTSVLSFVLTAVLIFGLTHWQNYAVPYEQEIMPFLFEDGENYNWSDDWGSDDYIENPDEYGSDGHYDSDHIDEDHAL
jgi:hypothetical protein